MRILFFFLLFLSLGAFFIISNENLHLGDSSELYLLGKHYYSWISGLFDNVNSISNYVVKNEWLPEKTNITK